MLRASSGPSHIATALFVALLVSSSASAEAELELPAPARPTSVRAIAIRADIGPRPDGVHRALVTLTVLNPETESQDLFVAPGDPAAIVTRAGEPVRKTQDGSSKLSLEAGEVAVLQVERRLVAAVSAFLTAGDAGWLGEARGALLQPVHRLEVAHPAGSPWTSATLEVHVRPGGELLACSLMASEGAVASVDGSVTWNFAAGEAPASLSLAWPAVENETFLPIDALEASHFEQHWTRRRGIEAEAVRLVRSGILVVHGEGFDDEKVRRAFEPAKRMGWAEIPGPPTRSEREAAAALAAFADRLELAGSPRTVAAAAPPAAPPMPAPPELTPAPAAPEAVAPPATTPEATTAEATTPVGVAAAPDPAPREAARPPGVPARRAARAAELQEPDLENADAGEEVTRAAEASWRGETLLQTESSVPSTPERARRWAKRALRGGHGVSRTILARESVAALHGKTWGPGFVSEFFSRSPWYRPDAGYAFESLSEDEKTAWKVLDSLVRAVRDGLELAPEEAEPAAQPAPTLPATESPVAAGRRPPDEAQSPQDLPPSSGPESEAVAAAPAAKPEGPPVPWIQNPAQARIFVFKEKAAGLNHERIALAIATIEARHGKPFDGDGTLRAFFDGQDWYRPEMGYGPERLSIPARESITLLRNALDQQTH